MNIVESTEKKKLYFVQIGQDVTTGAPNPHTGHMSYYGITAIFSTAKKRKTFVDNYYNHNNPSEYVRSVSKRGARGYNLGMSVYRFEEYLSSLTVDALVTD